MLVAVRRLSKTGSAQPCVPRASICSRVTAIRGSSAAAACWCHQHLSRLRRSFRVVSHRFASSLPAGRVKHQRPNKAAAWAISPAAASSAALSDHD